MGFLQNQFMKKIYKNLEELVQADELRIEMLPLPFNVSEAYEKTSDNMIVIYSEDRVASYIFYATTMGADTHVFGTATNQQGSWDFDSKNTVFTPFSVQDLYSECVAIITELAMVLSLRNVIRNSDDLEEKSYFEEMLQTKYGITLDDSNREITIRIIKYFGEEIPALSFGSRLIF